MPGSTPATSQLDWLSSTTAMIVLSWSKATRDLLKSFSWGIGALRQLFASDDGAISSPPAPYHLTAGGRRIRTLGPSREGRRKSGSQRTRWWAGGVRPGRLEDVCCGKNCSAFTGGFLLNLTDWQKISVSRVKR